MSDRNEPPFPEYDPYEGLTDLTGKEPLPLLEDPTLPPATPPRSPLLTGLILGLLLVVLSIAVFNLTRDDTTPVAGSETGTTAPATDDTVGDGTETPDDTTAGETTTTTAPTTTTEAPAQFDPYPVVGDPIPHSDLTLQTNGIGPLSLGSPAADAVGQLTASFGEATSDTGPMTSDGSFGACTDSLARVVKFGALAAIVVIDPDGTEIFGGYRLDLTYDGAASSPAAELETLSGLKLGYSVTQLRDIYAAFDVELVTDPDLGRIFELRGGSGTLLLWGPVLDSGNEGTDQIMGIYSVDASVNFCL
ncbi:MAG: hypothetical protein GY788_15635 [bacterium]|nr:hypothetical protein [bacterium]